MGKLETTVLLPNLRVVNTPAKQHKVKHGATDVVCSNHAARKRAGRDVCAKRMDIGAAAVSASSPHNPLHCDSIGEF